MVLRSGLNLKCNKILLNVFFDDKMNYIIRKCKVTIYLYEEIYV